MTLTSASPAEAQQRCSDDPILTEVWGARRGLDLKCWQRIPFLRGKCPAGEASIFVMAKANLLEAEAGAAADASPREQRGQPTKRTQQAVASCRV